MHQCLEACPCFKASQPSACNGSKAGCHVLPPPTFLPSFNPTTPSPVQFPAFYVSSAGSRCCRCRPLLRSQLRPPLRASAASIVFRAPQLKMILTAISLTRMPVIQNKMSLPGGAHASAMRLRLAEMEMIRLVTDAFLLELSIPVTR